MFRFEIDDLNNHDNDNTNNNNNNSSNNDAHKTAMHNYSEWAIIQKTMIINRNR